MLAVTPAATKALVSLLRSPEVPEGAGVRLAHGLAADAQARTHHPGSAEVPVPDPRPPVPDPVPPIPEPDPAPPIPEPEPVPRA